MNTLDPRSVVQIPNTHLEPALELSKISEAVPQSLKMCSAPINWGSNDPHGLRVSAPLAFATYVVALEYHPKLQNGTLGKEAVLQRLKKLAPESAFQIDYVAWQAFKFINPHGHGANSTRFRNETLGWFHQTYPADSHLTAGLILFLCAAKWWTHEQGYRSTIPRTRPLTTSDLDNKLKSFGFLSGERRALCRMLRRDRLHDN